MAANASGPSQPKRSANAGAPVLAAARTTWPPIVAPTISAHATPSAPSGTPCGRHPANAAAAAATGSKSEASTVQPEGFVAAR